MDNQEIDLSKVNWNNLSPEEFQNLSEKMNERNNRIKETKERKKRTLSENILVSIGVMLIIYRIKFMTD